MGIVVSPIGGNCVNWPFPLLTVKALISEKSGHSFRKKSGWRGGRVELLNFDGVAWCGGVSLGGTNEAVTLLLNKLGEGDQHAATQLVPLVYEELRRMA